MASLKPISGEESSLIRALLAAKNAPHQIKRGLQRLCGHLEKGRRFAESQNLRQLAVGLLWDENVYVRMYAFKALGLFRQPEDSNAIVGRLKIEQDFETQTWGMAALIGVAGDRDIDQVFRESGLDNSLPLLLAGQLYANPKWTRDNYRPLLVPENSDRITMKWAVLLVAYGKAPPNLFSPRHDNRLLLGELNTHDIDEVAEHSTWALFEHPDYGPADYKVDLHNVPRLPPNVKKWAFRLLMSDPTGSGIDCDALAQLRRDPDVAAREGLALGLDAFGDEGADQVILEWYEAERDDAVKDILLEHMASAPVNADYSEAVLKAFEIGGPGTPLRKRLLAAGDGKPIGAQMKRRLALEAITDAGMTRELLGGDFIMGNQIKATGNMSGNFAGGDMTAQTIAGGNMINSANAAVQTLSQERAAQKELLESILSVLKEGAGFPEGGSEAVAAAVEEIAKDPSPKNKMGLFGALKALASGAGMATSLVENIGGLADAVQAAFT